MLIRWWEWGEFSKAHWIMHVDSRLQWEILYENKTWSCMYLQTELNMRNLQI